MQRKTPKLLEDIRDAAAFVRDETSTKTLENYREDRLLRQAVERNFEVIGEAVGRLAKSDPTTAAQLSNYEQIIAFRNLLIHGYDLIDDSQVWDVIQRSLPTLEREVISLLGDAKQND
jgi:uncharacterized protein with HEPN domain